MDAMNYSTRDQKTAENYQNYRNWNGEGVQFRPENMQDESGVCSPPLWKTSPPRSPTLSGKHPNSHRYLSPTSRAQAIARGQWELMEMVKKMPESSYELSLKDLVEHQHQPRSVEAKEDNLIKETDVGEEVRPQRSKAKRQESKGREKKGKMKRNESFDRGGLFLKMVFPISLGSKKNKKKKNNLGTNTCAKVSPRPENLDKSSKGGDKDWWKKRFSSSSEGEIGGSSGSSGSRSSNSNNSTRKRIVFLPACWPRLCTKNSKSAK